MNRMMVRSYPARLAMALAAGGFTSGCISSVYAAVSLPAIFSDHAVLQRAPSVPIWGKGAVGEGVTVRVAEVSVRAVTDAAGMWRVRLDLSLVPAGPQQLIVEASNRVVVNDVVVGEVWLCSGQSNMEWMLSGADDKAAELARPPNPSLRQFTVKRSAAATPRDDCVGRWTVAGPATSAEFSAIAYHFGRIIQEKTGAAVGLINASWGGTPIEFWLSPRAMAGDPELAAGNTRNLQREARFPEELAAFVARGEAWVKRFERADRAVSDLESYTTKPVSSRWKRVVLPEGLAAANLPKSGAIWLRRTVRVPERIETIGLNRGFLVGIGAFSGFEQLYWNGVKAGESSWNRPPPSGARRHAIPPKLLQPGTEATIALRIFNPLDTGFVHTTGGGSFSADTVDLRGEWQVAVEFDLPDLPPDTRAAYPRIPPRAPMVGSRMFNGLIAPIVGYGLRGFIWYQGESNTPRAAQYTRAFPTLIRDWREHWGNGDLPFYFCQLANAKPKRTEPGDSSWAELREAQAHTLAVPNTGMAVLIDIGEEADEHPRNKREAAARIARIALARDYGQPVVAGGPVFESATFAGPIARVRFRGTDGGLVARDLPENYRPRSTQTSMVPLRRHSPGGAIEGFALCGSDHRWFWADSAVIQGEEVLVRSRDVADPKAVRYAWADNPTCNLYNGAGLPAAPFRTDTDRRSTEDEKF
jgi:sialate O-acetylesterase